MPTSTEPAAIAVVGMACWYPGARSPRELWENILARRQEFRAFLEERMPARDYHDPDPAAPDKTYGELGAFIDGFRFDPGAWRVPRPSFLSADIAHWLALDVAAKALTDAGFPAGEGLVRERTGVIVGNSLTGEMTRATSMRLRWPFVRRLVEAEARRHLPEEEVASLVEAVGERYRSHFPPTSEDTLAGALSNTIAGRICGMFDFGGGGYVVDGACASSMLAVCTAASALEEGRVDAVVAGGVDISMDPFELVGFAKAKALTPTDMRVYDRRGNGFIPGEGCGFVVLQRLADARAAGRPVYAVLRGWGVASDGKNAITAPKVEGQARAIRAAWARSGRPDLVEGHGTGTTLGDKVELRAIATVAAEMSSDERAIGVTSLKSILGHTKAAAGIGAFLKAVIAANRRVLPPVAGCEEPNEVFDGDARSLFPVLQGERRDPESTLLVGASAMGFGGIDTHAVVASGDAPDPRLAPSLDEGALLASAQDAEIFVLGGDSLEAVRGRARALVATAARIARAEMADLSADLIRGLGGESAGEGVGEDPATEPGGPRRARSTAARVHLAQRVRVAIIASSPRELATRLARFAEGGDGPGIHVGTPSSTPRVGFLFPGQGSQAPGAARSLLARDPTIEQRIRGLAPAGLYEAMFPSDRAVSAAERGTAVERLADTTLAQPALCLTSLAWVHRLATLGVVPSVVAGHSLGELTAFAVAGAIRDDELVSLATARGRAMAAPATRPAGMTAVVADRERVEALLVGLPGYAAVANVNGPEQVVVAGEIGALEALERAASAAGITTRRLGVSNGFHSELVSDAAECLRKDAAIPEQVRPPTITLLSSLFPEPVEVGSFRDHVADHVRALVDFLDLAKRMATHADLVLEVGSGRALSGLFERALPGGRCLPVESTPGRATDLLTALAAAWTAGVDVRWEALHSGRLVRPFVAPERRVFLVNPCEAAPRRESVDGVARSRETFAVGRSGTPRRAPGQSFETIEAGDIGAATARRAGVPDRVDPSPYARRAPGTIAGLAGAGDIDVPFRAAPVRNGHARFGEAILAGIIAAVAEKTGFDPASILPTQRLQEDLNLDSIKAGEIVAAAARRAGVADRVDPASYVRQPLGTIAEALAGLAGAGDIHVAARATHGRNGHARFGEAILAGIIAAVAEKTGFDPASILPTQRLQEDLNLDSIKAGEIVAAAARRAGVADRVDPASYVRQPLGAIAGALASLAPNEPGSGGRDPWAGADERERLGGARPASARAGAAFAVAPEARGADASRAVRQQTGERGRSPVGAGGAAFGVVAESPSADASLAELMAAVAEKTGFDLSSIEPTQRLQEDLNLDSIKAGEIVAAAARRAGVADRVDPASYVRQPLGTIAQALAVLAADRGREGGDPLRSVARSGPRAQGGGTPTVRTTTEFAEDTEEEGRMSSRAATVVGATCHGFDRRSSITPGREEGGDRGDLGPFSGSLADRGREDGGDRGDLGPSERGISDRGREDGGDRDDLGPFSGSLVDRGRKDGGHRGDLGPSERGVSDRGREDRGDPGPRTNRPDGLRAAPLEPTPVGSGAERGARPSALGPPKTAAPLSRWVRTFTLDTVPSAPEPRGSWAGRRVRVLGSRRLAEALVSAGAILDDTGADVVAVLDAGSIRARVAQLHAVAAATPRSGSLLLVQRLDGRFGLSHVGDAAPGAAFARSIALERPSLAVKVLDVAHDLDEDVVLDAVLVGPPAPGFGARGHDPMGEWSLVASPLPPASIRPREHGLGPDDLVLVTGGAKGITAACAEALARATGCRLALVGSTPVDRVDSEVLATLGRLTLRGIQARYWACDLGDADAVTRLVAEVRAAQGPIAALVHGAGRNTPRRVEQVAPEAALAEIAPKLVGGEALLAALDDAPPRLVVAFTSIIGVSGMAGNAWYAFANEALDLAVAAFAARHPGTQTLSLASGVWSDIGMGARLDSVATLAKMGVGALDPAEGVARFLALVTGDPGVRQPIVTAHIDGLPTWPAPGFDAAGLRFLEGARTGVPGVEAVVRLRLSPERDPWLRDHDFKGSLLLPTVFGLEAMAQVACAARAALGPVARFEAVELPAPVVVAEGGTLVEVRARVSEEHPELVECEVRTEATGFARAHFASRVVFARGGADRGSSRAADGAPASREIGTGGGAEIAPVVDGGPPGPADSRGLPPGPPASFAALPAPEPSLDPIRDLYTRLLFQGPAFQRITTITGGRADSYAPSEVCAVGGGSASSRAVDPTVPDSSCAVAVVGSAGAPTPGRRALTFTADVVGPDSIPLAPAKPGAGAGHPRPDLGSADSGSPAPAVERWVAGDPFFRDALLQSAQVLVAQDDALPVRIERVELFAGHDVAGARTAWAEVHTSTERRHVGEVRVRGASGRLEQALVGYEVQVLAHHPDRPDAETIFRPGDSDVRRLRETFADLAGVRLGLWSREDVILGRASGETHDGSGGQSSGTTGALGTGGVGVRLPYGDAGARPRRSAGPFDHAVQAALVATISASPLGWEGPRPVLGDEGVSITHDDTLCLAAVAPTRVGCDIEAITTRDWVGAVGPVRARLLPTLRSGGDDADLAGARVWTAGEALYKAGDAAAIPVFAARDGSTVTFTAAGYRVVTRPFAPARGPRRIVAIALAEATCVGRTGAPDIHVLGPSGEARASGDLGSGTSLPGSTDAVTAPDTVPSDLLAVTMRNERMVVRFVVTFDESASVSGRVQAITLASWMGRLRELALAGLRDALLEALDTGRHGMVTQNAWVRLTGEASALDRVEAEVWVEELRPSSCLLRFAFTRLGEGGARSPLGDAAQRFGWVEVLDHSQVRAASFPGFLQAFLEGLHHAAPVPPAPAPLALPAAPALARGSFATTLVEGNVVGNLYYAHSFKWAQRVLDGLVWRSAPGSLRTRGRDGELVLTGMRVEYLREAMPFDTVEVSVHPAEGEAPLTFDVVWQRREADGSVTRLAVGRLDGTWAIRRDGRLISLGAPPWAPTETPRRELHAK